MQQLELLTYGKVYHIYNRGINRCDIFKTKENYTYFLNLYDKHLSPIADTLAWVLMKNHIHLLVKIKENKADSTKPYQSFSNLFNAYAKAFNKQQNRTGSLFEHPFHRKQISDIEYFKHLVVYIHNNPVHHGFVKYAMDYPWSSYLTIISVKPTHVRRDEVMGWFDNAANFKAAHEKDQDDLDLEKWLGLI